MWIYRTNELEDLIERSQDNLRKIENDIEESQGERAEKLKGLIAQEKVRKGTVGHVTITWLIMLLIIIIIEFVDNYEPEKEKELVSEHYTIEYTVNTIYGHCIGYYS